MAFDAAQTDPEQIDATIRQVTHSRLSLREYVRTAPPRGDSLIASSGGVYSTNFSLNEGSFVA